MHVLLASLPLLIRSPILLDESCVLTASVTLNTSLNALSPNVTTLGIRTSAYEFGGRTIQSITKKHKYKKDNLQKI